MFKFKCPHCAKKVLLDVSVEDVTKAKTLPEDEDDFEKALSQVVKEAPCEKQVIPDEDPVQGLDSFSLAIGEGKLGNEDAGLADGWFSNGRQLMKAREQQIRKGQYNPEEAATSQDPEVAEGERKAAEVRNAIMGALGGGQ